MLLVQSYFQGQAAVTPEETEDRIHLLVAWEQSQGYGDDVSIAQMKVIAEEYLGLKARVLTDVTPVDLERELAAGHPIVAPFAGRDLHNPYFSGEGPWYHVLVVIGYDGEHFITNDVGTRRGKHYVYDRDVLYSALHDWNGVKEKTNEGRKNVLVIDGLAGLKGRS